MSKWLKRIGIFIGVIALISVVLFGIFVWSMRRSVQSSATLLPQKFTPLHPALSDVNESTARQDSSNRDVTGFTAATDDDPSIGPASAAVTIVEFSDFECPFCKQAFPIIRELMAKYSDRVRYVYRDFPVSEIHDNAQKSAEAGACAHAQGKFWALHDKIFQNAPQIAVPDVKNYARASGLDMSLFTTCLDSGQFANEVQKDYSDGVALGVRGTPTWFINGRKVEGVIPRDVFTKLLDQLLATEAK